MQTAFVTGGTGFLGLNLVSALKQEGWKVIAVHREGSSTARLAGLGAELRKADIGDPSALASAMPDDVDAVFHVAGDVSWWRGHDERQHRVNVDGTRHVVDAALSRKAKRFIYTSSVAAFGIGHAVIDEATVSTAANSSIGYVRSKWLGQEEVRKGIGKGLAAVILNPAYIMGPYDSTGWARMFRQLKKGKLPAVPPGTGSYCHVHEVARAHVEAVTKGRIGEQYVLAGTDATFVELTTIMADLLGVTPPKAAPAYVLKTLGAVKDWVSLFTKKEPDITAANAAMLCARWRASSSKAERELGFKTVSLRAMTEDAYRWLVEEGII